MARTRWPPGPVNPGLFPGQADQTGSAGGCLKLGPGRQTDLKTARAASADSEVRPGPRPRPTPIPPQNLGSRAGSATHILPADSARVVALALRLGRSVQSAELCVGGCPFFAVMVPAMLAAGIG